MSSFKEIEKSIYEFVCESVKVGEKIELEDFYDKIFEELKYIPDQVDPCFSSLVSNGMFKKIGMGTNYIRLK
ncbi:hypothetical protein [Clostridium perfringens]|uniref:hypothetical protein n=1 Tax=Clostridium perfringens TaxID=1502 RepID=UPI001F06538C|nr:hypothetical protein [Clostridium perfringens]